MVIRGPRLIDIWELMKQLLPDRNHGAAFVLGYTFAAYRNLPPDVAVPDSARDAFTRAMTGAREECERMGLSTSVIHINEELRMANAKAANLTHGDIAKAAEGVSDTIRYEMKSRVVFTIPPEMQKYYGATAAFGGDVARAFTRAEYDIAEAGNCLALSRATASVFHCMRVLEHGLCALANRFGLSTDQPQWNEMIEQTEAAITKINRQKNKPKNWKDEEQFYSAAASQFRHFKNAWRNYTAHIQFKYTETEAESIYRHVGEFMAQIAKRLKEQPEELGS